MTQNTSPPPFIGLLGAALALGITRGLSSAFGVNISYFVGVLTLLVGSIIGVVLLSRYLYRKIKSWHNNKEWYNQIDSRLVSAYYRFRVKFLVAVSLIDTS